MDHFICGFEIKSEPDNTRTFVGYASVFGNIDAAGDIVAKGAFTKTIASAESGATAWPAMLLQHGGMTSEDATPVGLWLDISQDDYGLKVKGKFANTTRGREAYELLKMKPRPALNGLSVGFRAKNYTIHKSGPIKRTLTEIDLVEVSLVTFPANTKAVVTSVKSALEPVPVVVDWKAVARADFDRLAKEMTRHNRNWR